MTVQGTWQFISTWQLLDPGKIYEVSDELESFFFVILYEGVHWVTHNKPKTLRVKHIFDDVQVEADGQQTGGSGKCRMYTVDGNVILQHLEFTKFPPFTDLIRGLFRLFQSLTFVNQANCAGRQGAIFPHDIENANRLNDCKTVIQLTKDALKRTDWPQESDKVTSDNYPRKQEVDKVDRVGLANLKVTTATIDAPAPAALPTSTGISRTSKRGREDDGQVSPTKRSKVETV